MSKHVPKAHGHKARKRFGQNFLHDQYVIDKIVRAIHPVPEDRLVEIGPGIGAITEPLLEAAGRLDVVELDRDLIPILRTKFFNYPDFCIHEGDALKFDFNQIAEQQPLRIVGNLPYNISTPLIFHLLSHHNTVQDMHFMLQKEVVKRMVAGPGSKAFGRLSVMTQYYCHAMPVIDVPPECFKPAPKVDSAVIRLIPKKPEQRSAKSTKLLNTVCLEAFNQRRKTLRNSLSNLLTAEELTSIGIDITLRAESLTLKQFIDIANWIDDNKQ